MAAFQQDNRRSTDDHILQDNRKGRPYPTTNGGVVLRGLLTGLVPLALLLVVVVITLLLAAATRQLFAFAGFFVQQQNTLIVLIVGLSVAVMLYGVSIWRIMRRLAHWEQEGKVRQVHTVLWTLVGTACVVVLPLVLAFVLPQHPAP